MNQNKPGDDDWSLDPTQKVLDLTEDLFSSEPTETKAVPALIKSEGQSSQRTNTDDIADAENRYQDGAEMTQSIFSPAAVVPLIRSRPNSAVSTPKRARYINQNANKNDYTANMTSIEESYSSTTTGSEINDSKRPRVETARSVKIATKMEAFRHKIVEQLCSDKDASFNASQAQSDLAKSRPSSDYRTIDEDRGRISECQIHQRRIGAILAQKDNDRLAFSERNIFSKCEIVAVARSGDRFDYGQVLSDSGSTVTILICESPPLKKQLPYVLVGKIRCEEIDDHSNRQRRLSEILNSSEEIYSLLKSQDKSFPMTLLNIAHFVLMFNMRLLHKIGAVNQQNPRPSIPPPEMTPRANTTSRTARCLIQKQSEAWKLQLDALKQQATSQIHMWDTVLELLSDD